MAFRENQMKEIMAIATHKLMIQCEEDVGILAHPHCQHGPTLLFYYQDEGPEYGYFACAAHRDKKSCNYMLPVNKLSRDMINRRPELSTDEYRVARKKFLNNPNSEQRNYCHSCNQPLLQAELQQHAGHDLVMKLSKKFMQDPTLFLRPLENDKVQAQYFFDQKALKFFQKCFQEQQITKVLCIGAPRLHAHLRTHCSGSIKSYLLDFDHRFYYFFTDKHFAWYNMCNNYLLDQEGDSYFKRFLRMSDENERFLIFTDPPFGCRTEPIANTLHQLTLLYNSTNGRKHQPLPIFWIFPYFSAHYIQQYMPELQICDYKVNYTNHSAYSDGLGGRKQGSPARIFTNIPLDRLKLPVTEEYKYCTQCQMYTALENRHCDKCKECPARNGSTYRHCELCGLCVKPSYVHCQNCRRCTQSEGHNCEEYQLRQRCWICLRLGHIERYCEAWQQYCKLQGFKRKFSEQQAIIKCMLCEKIGHNERSCKLRNKHLIDTTFMGETQSVFRV